MPPEYAIHGQFSVKSDVYSFGVLILEIICGKKNSSFYQSDIGLDLVSYVRETSLHKFYYIYAKSNEYFERGEKEEFCHP